MGAKGFLRSLTDRGQSSSPYAGLDLPDGVILPGNTKARLGVLEDFEKAGFGWLWASDAEGRPYPDDAIDLGDVTLGN